MQQVAGGGPPGSKGPTTAGRKWWVFAAIGVGSFMSTLDSSVVNIILPVVKDAFRTDVASLEWVVTIYLLVLAALLLTFGRLGDLRGHKTVYVWGFAVFILGSALSGAAPNVVALVACRGLQALGAAVLLSNSPAILTGTFPAAQRGQVLGLQSTVTYLGLTIGPSLGGWLAGHWGWRSVFYVNVPIGLLALFLSLRFIPRDEGTARTERFDVVGAATLTAGLVALLLGLNQGHAWGWGSPGLLALLAAALLLLVLFVFVERKSASPMLDLTLFRSRVFSFSVASAMLNYVTMASVLFLMPFFLQQGRGLSPIQAGLVLTAQPLVMAVAAPLSGALSDRIGQRVPATLGMVVLAAGVVLLGRLGPQAAVGVVAAMLAVVGLGTGAFISPNSSALMGAAPRHRQGVAAGMLAEARVIGQVLGVGLAGAIYTTIMARQGGGQPSATLFAAIHTSFIVASGLAALGALASAVRGVHKGTVTEGKP